MGEGGPAKARMTGYTPLAALTDGTRPMPVMPYSHEGRSRAPRCAAIDGWQEHDVTQPLLIEHDDGVDRVTLNRPDSLNALNPR